MTSSGADTPAQSYRKPRRLGYRKSRTGCQSCRARKVKCDERRPRCLACERYDIDCQYPSESEPSSTQSPRSAIQTPPPTTVADTISLSSQSPSDQHVLEAVPRDLSSTRPEAHRLELRLLHHFTTYTCKTLPGGDNTQVSERWAVYVPPLAFEHHTLLQAIFAVSSAHLNELDPTNPAYRAASRHYFASALTEHNRALSTLNSSTADIICLTCLLISVLAFNFDTLDENNGPRDPSTSTLQSLFISYGSSEVFKTAWRWIRDDATSEASKIARMSPQFEEVHRGTARYDQLGQSYPQLVYPEGDMIEFAYLLPSWRKDAELFEDEHYDPEVEKAFRLAISYISSVQKAVQAQESDTILCRRIMGFTTSVPKHFLDLARNNQPRVLVVLAHYFALTKSAQSVWWLRGLASRCVNSIFRLLPEKWRLLMRRPFEMIEEAWPEDTYVSSQS